MRLLTPARLALLSTRAPSYPRSVNSRPAAARIAALVDCGSRVLPRRNNRSRGCVAPPATRRTFAPLAGDLSIGIVLGSDFDKRSYPLSSRGRAQQLNPSRPGRTPDTPGARLS